MNDIRLLKEQQRLKHPGFDGYMNCMTRTLFGGLATFCLCFSGTYFIQKIVQTKYSYSLKYNILMSTILATAVSYYTTILKTKECQVAWMAVEDKYSILKEEDY